MLKVGYVQNVNTEKLQVDSYILKCKLLDSIVVNIKNIRLLKR